MKIRDIYLSSSSHFQEQLYRTFENSTKTPPIAAIKSMTMGLSARMDVIYSADHLNRTRFRVNQFTVGIDQVEFAKFLVFSRMKVNFMDQSSFHLAFPAQKR